MTDIDETTGTELATTGPAGDLTKTEQLKAELFKYWQGLSVSDDADVQERILAQLLAAQSPSELLHAGETTPATELVGVPLRFVGIRASESEYDAGVDWYLHVDAVIIANGDTVTFSCGARDVCIKLVMASMKGWFPIDGQLVKAAKPTKAGFFPLFLQELPPDF